MFRLLHLIALLGYCSAGILPRASFGLQPLRDTRIVGGSETSIEAFPHQLSMRWFSSHRCGGSIIKSDVVITAAHCVIGIPLINLAFIAGTSNVKQGGETRKLKTRVIHEKYDDPSSDYDVAVILLQSGFDFSTKIQPIHLADANEELPAGTRVLVSGWGNLEQNGPKPDILQYVALNAISTEECARYYSGVRTVTSSMFCAGAPGGDACQGDSGGPLIMGNKLYGIVSWGIGCGRPEYPGVYAKISVVRNWIDSVLKQF